jgi:hypothetical protein
MTDSAGYSSRFIRLINATDTVLHADPAYVQAILARWSPGASSDGERLVVTSESQALAALVDYLDDEGLEALLTLIDPATALDAEMVLLGAAAGLTAPEIADLIDTPEQRNRLLTLVGLRHHGR